MHKAGAPLQLLRRPSRVWSTATEPSNIRSPFRQGSAAFWPPSCTTGADTLSVQVPLPVAAEAASGDALLIPADGRPLRAHQQYLSLASSTITRRLQQAQSQVADGELLRLVLPHTSEREAALLLKAINRLNKYLFG